MRHAIDVAPLGELADPRRVVELARAAEAAGWDGVSVWDNLGTGMGAPFGEQFVTLAAVAASTERLRLITSATILPRRRPQLVAQAAATLDLLSGGRLVLGVGAGGDPPDFEAFGEPVDARTRAARLDEALPIVDAFLRSEIVDHDGPTYVVRGVGVGPAPAQEPRPPIWVGGMHGAALRRAARWDGWIGLGVAADGSISMPVSPAQIGTAVGRIRSERAALGRADDPFDVALLGYSEPDAAGTVGEYGAAGVTWWLESLHPMRGPFDVLLARIAAGPPRG
jgi:alkanesulfonate monooxygenase SsuD/methylene tetrahydromethanopterin reductase-like flavin-dependent oxidoreductase (luciferase family)